MKHQINSVFVPEEILSFNEIKIEMKNKEEVLITDHPGNVREKIEDMLSERLGFYPCLHEDVEDGNLVVALHSDSYEDLEEDQIDQLTKVGITETEESTTEAIKNFLGVEFRFVV
jgi:glycosylphosphatidylinositol transamidase (GPIT) subunit GPI8